MLNLEITMSKEGGSLRLPPYLVWIFLTPVVNKRQFVGPHYLTIPRRRTPVWRCQIADQCGKTLRQNTISEIAFGDIFRQKHFAQSAFNWRKLSRPISAN